MINKAVGEKQYTNNLGWIYQEIKGVICVFKNKMLVKTLTPDEFEELLRTRTVYPK